MAGVARRVSRQPPLHLRDGEEIDLRAAVDVGGTFTDVVLFDEERNAITLGKALTTPQQLAQGVQEALTKGGVPLPETSLLIHGSTIVVNAVIERKGAKTALVTTKGFRDVYEVGRVNRPESFNLRFRKHRPLVPRELVFEINERLLYDGSVFTALDEPQAREVCAILGEEGIEAVAVVFLHSYREPVHEVRMAQLVAETNPNAFVTVSHELSREYREYERTSTTAANAYVGPIVSRYLDDLEDQLANRGFAGDLMIMQSNGGLQDVETSRRQCIQMMESGPAGGVVGTMALCELLGLENAIAFDMGGTTAKACVVRRGEPQLSPDFFFGGYNEGLAIRIPVLDIIEVGTGGGSIAWIDDGGALHVGPLSAGAEPGPVSYGHGGTEPTITDANVVLGRLDPQRFLGGEMKLDRDAAVAALRTRLAEPLNVSLERAASGILEIAVNSMGDAVRGVTLEQGLDPRDFTLVAYGGGGPLHAGAVARELQIERLIIPQAPGHFSALGMLMADLRRDFVQTLFTRLNEIDIAELENEFVKLQEEGQAVLAESGTATSDVVFERSADMRYVGQEHSVAVKMPAHIEGEGARAQLKQLFDDAHEARYSHHAPDEPCDVVTLRVTAIGRTSKPGLPEIETGDATPPAAADLGTRTIFFEGSGELISRVFERAALLAGNHIEGPAAIEDTASVTILGPKDSAEVDRYGLLLISVGDL